MGTPIRFNYDGLLVVSSQLVLENLREYGTSVNTVLRGGEAKKMLTDSINNLMIYSRSVDFRSLYFGEEPSTQVDMLAHLLDKHSNDLEQRMRSFVDSEIDEIIQPVVKDCLSSRYARLATTTYISGKIKTELEVDIEVEDDFNIRITEGKHPLIFDYINERLLKDKVALKDNDAIFKAADEYIFLFCKKLKVPRDQRSEIIDGVLGVLELRYAKSDLKETDSRSIC